MGAYPLPERGLIAADAFDPRLNGIPLLELASHLKLFAADMEEFAGVARALFAAITPTQANLCATLVTRKRIRQIEAKVLRKLKHPSRSRELRSFLDS